MESIASFKLVAPHYIDFTYRFVIYDMEYFPYSSAGIFWASYINAPKDKKINFKGWVGGFGSYFTGAKPQPCNSYQVYINLILKPLKKSGGRKVGSFAAASLQIPQYSHLSLFFQTDCITPSGLMFWRLESYNQCYCLYPDVLSYGVRIKL